MTLAQWANSTSSDKAEALRLYAKQVKDNGLETWAAEIKLRAQRRLGGMSRELEKAHKAGRGDDVQLPTTGKSKAATLKAASVPTSTAHC